MGERGTDQPIDRESHPPMRWRPSNHSRRPSLKVPKRSTDRLLMGAYCCTGNDRVARCEHQARWLGRREGQRVARPSSAVRARERGARRRAMQHPGEIVRPHGALHAEYGCSGPDPLAARPPLEQIPNLSSRVCEEVAASQVAQRREAKHREPSTVLTRSADTSPRFALRRPPRRHEALGVSGRSRPGPPEA